MLVGSFPGILDAKFTARMEEELDEVEEGKLPWLSVIKEFYGPFRESLERAKTQMKDVKREEMPTDILCAKCASPMVVKWGRRGKFLACSNFPQCKATSDFTTDETGRIRPVEKEKPVSEEKCPECGKPMLIKSGRFGRFLACSDYPQCKTTRPFSTGIPCPEKECTGMLLERRTKKGRTFYGCSNYPACTYATWEKPRPRSEPASEGKPVG
jgi:DNA topoisomerase-1